jgi:hypothetical protein
MKTFSKSDFKLARDCPAKLTWRERGYPNTLDDNQYLALLAEGGYMVEQLARLMFSEGVELQYDPRRPREAWDVTREAIARDGTWFEATLLAGRQLARVDILRRTGNRFDLFEVKSKSFEEDNLDEGPGGPFRAKRKPHGILAKWRPYLEDVTYQVHVLQRLHPEAEIRAHLIVVNKGATATIEGMPRLFRITRGTTPEETDLDVRFIGDPAEVDPEELLGVVPVDAEVEELFQEVRTFADAQEGRYSDEGIAHQPAPIGMHCAKCEYRVDSSQALNGFRECWGALAPEGASILDLHKFGATKHNGEKLGDLMIQGGRVAQEDVDPRHLVTATGTPTAASSRQLIQIAHTASKTVWADPPLGEAMAGVTYPLHFLDFETSQLAIPYHAGMRPYQSVGFQWSCHTVPAPGAAPVHREWLNVEDLWPAPDFIGSLRDLLGDAGTVLIWSKYERTIMRQQRDQLAARGLLDDALLNWLAPFSDKDHPETRLLDQHALCLKHYFHPEMHGKTSIKWVLDAIWQDDPEVRKQFTAWMGEDAYEVPDGAGPYDALPVVEINGTVLDVADGTGAMRAYQAMLYGDPADREAHGDQWTALLRRYCKLDTLAMVLIWEHWRRAVGEG